MLPSELILNPDGSIYHLHLRPEHLADTIIFVGDPERVPQVSAYFDSIEVKIQKREFVTHTGKVSGRRITVLSTGIGTDNIDIVLNELDALVNINLKTGRVKSKKKKLTIIRLGTSGSIQADAPIDTLLLSEGALGFDGLGHFYAGNKLIRHPILRALRSYGSGKWSFPAKPYYAAADAQLFAFFSKFIPQHGITATNSGFYAPQGRWLRAKPRHANYVEFLANFQYEGHRITNLEMETAGIYGLSALLGHRALSVNALLANRANGTFSQKPKEVIEQMIMQTVREIIPKAPFLG